MRILSLHIWGYKNLKDFKTKFDENSPFTFLIGKNGSGKSNLLEAILYIFYALETRNLNNIEFSFEITYKIKTKTVCIKYPNVPLKEILINDVPCSKNQFKTIKLEPDLPEYIFSYYSGTCERVKIKIKNYESNYKRKLKRSSNSVIENDGLRKKLDYGNIKNANYILASLYASNKSFLSTYFNIIRIENIRLKLIPTPAFDPQKSLSKELGLKGQMRNFILDIENISSNLKEERYYNDKADKDSDLYTLYSYKYYFDNNSWGKLAQIAEKSSNLFTMLMQLLQEKVIASFDYDIVLKGEKKITIDQLSEGEKQLLLVMGMTKFNKGREGLFLLDEPDTHLNPAWSIKFREILKDTLGSTSISNHFFITTHSPLLFAGTKREEVFMFDNEENGIVANKPQNDPRGMGIAGILTDEFFGLESSLDPETQKDMDRHLELAYKNNLSEEDKKELRDINNRLMESGASMTFRDPNYAKFEESWVKAGKPELSMEELDEILKEDNIYKAKATVKRKQKMRNLKRDK